MRKLKKYSIGKFVEEIGLPIESGRLQGKREHKAKKMIEELKPDDSHKEN